MMYIGMVMNNYDSGCINCVANDSDIRKKPNKILFLFYKFFSKNIGGKKCFQKVFTYLDILLLAGMNIGLGEDVNASGEISFLNYLKSDLCECENLIFFDVGANVGVYTNLIGTIFETENIAVHCFEPSKNTFEVLKKNVNLDNSMLNNFGLSNENKKATLYQDKELSGLSSLYKRRLDHLDIWMDNNEIIELYTMDYYCKKNDILKIDLLKIDVEGNEIKVLEGAKELLSQGKIQWIQFEFGGCNIDSKSYFQDFWYILHQNYRIYRVLPQNIYEITEYSEYLERFLTTNYVAEYKGK